MAEIVRVHVGGAVVIQYPSCAVQQGHHEVSPYSVHPRVVLVLYCFGGTSMDPNHCVIV